MTTCDITAIQAIAPSGVTITSASIPTGETYCQVTGALVTDASKNDVINFEVSLPPVWNNRLVFMGDAIFAGALPDPTGDAYADALSLNYAVAGTDTGHQSSGIAVASWALNNEPAVQDFEYRAVHKSTVAAKAIADGYYGSNILYSYFQGCSTGGRQGIVEAEKYPTDFDGVIAGDPAIGDPYLGFNWNEQANLAPNAFLNVNAIELVDHAVTKQCGETESGISYPLVLNPPSCTFQSTGLPALQCVSGPEPSCLTSEEIATFNAIYDGAKDTGNNQIYPGYSVSNPADTGDGDYGWSSITGCSPFSLPCLLPEIGRAEPWGLAADGTDTALGPVQWVVQDGYLRFFVYENANYAPLSFSFSSQQQINQVTNKVTRWSSDGMEVANLTTFTNDGHKLLLYHGWSDPVLTPYISVNFFTNVQGVLGSTTTDSVRLFMVPGMHHCGGGPGPNFFDTLTPITQWVESGIAPDGIIATHYENNDPTQPVDRTMPLCSYPELPTYDGTGDPMKAANWTCQ